MRVRMSFDALRLCLLVAAGVVSGYLWRAAFESSTPETRLSGTPRIVRQAPAPTVVRIPPGRVSASKRTVGAHHRVPPHRSSSRLQVGTAALASSTVGPAPVSAPTSPQPTPTGPKPVPTPPKPTPTPTEPAPTPTTPSQSPAPPIPAARSEPSAPSEPAAEPTPSPPPTTPPTEPGGDERRPGWGKGDNNHDHEGPGHKNP